MYSESYLNALEQTLFAFKYQSQDYSIGCKTDSAECLENTGNNWEVFSFERGQKNHKKDFDDVYDACLYFIEEISDSYEKESEMKNYFKTILCKSTPRMFTHKLKTIIKDLAISL